ncbi:MAG TPA: pseudouridine synthase [Alphaproteobacteria bacterium]|nr:pseudouridine synthase [Alphaproteobacteria bacterium]
MRLNKFLSHAGVCSRRQADSLVQEGRVKVNGKVVLELGLKVEEKDLVHVDGVKVAQQEKLRVWRHYKPLGLVTTHKDPQNRPTVFDALDKSLGRLISVGRLDLNSEGLLLLTNSPEFATKAQEPKNGWDRVYKVRVHGTPEEKRLFGLLKGVTIDGVTYKCKDIEIERIGSTNHWLKVTLDEGKNKEIRRLMNHIDLEVNKLIRIQYGPFYLSDLKSGGIEEISESILKKQQKFLTT